MNDQIKEPYHRDPVVISDAPAPHSRDYILTKLNLLLTLPRENPYAHANKHLSIFNGDDVISWPLGRRYAIEFDTLK